MKGPLQIGSTAPKESYLLLAVATAPKNRHGRKNEATVLLLKPPEFATRLANFALMAKRTNKHRITYGNCVTAMHTTSWLLDDGAGVDLNHTLTTSLSWTNGMKCRV